MATPSGTSAGADRKKHGWVIRSHVGKVSCMMLKRMRTGGGPTGMVQVSEWYGWHFACRDRQKAAYRNVCPHAPRGYLGIHVDFGQSRTLPIGPKEGGRWWYANARVSVNVLVAYVWGCGMEAPMYITYLGNVSDHTPDYAIAVLHDITGRVWTNQVDH